MMTPTALNDGSCRLHIGVWGDRSCAELLAHIHCRNCPVYINTGRRLLDRPPSAAQIEDWQQDLARNVLPSDEARTSVVVFRIATEWLALPTALLREVIDPMPAHQIPHRQDPRFKGLVNVRGELMPCIELGRLLNPTTAVAESAQSWPRLLIIERQGESWALRVDDVEGVHQIARGALRAPPVTVGQGSPSFAAQIFSLAFTFVSLADRAARETTTGPPRRPVQLDAVQAQLRAAAGALKVDRDSGDIVLLDDELLMLALREVCQ